MPPKKKASVTSQDSVTASSTSETTPLRHTMRSLLTAYIRSGKAGLFITSYEEVRVQAELKAIAADRGFNLYVWSITEGLVNVTNDPPTMAPDTEEPIVMLRQFDGLPEKSIVLARDLHMLLADGNPVLVRKIKDSLLSGKLANRVLVACGCRLKLPPELEKEMAVVEFKLPDKEQLNVVLENVARSASVELNGNREAILDAASGMTTTEAEDAFAMSVVECQDIRPDVIAREKANTVKKNGILEIIETTATADSIGGLEILKEWVAKRKNAFTKKAREFGLPIPKGVLAVGIPGSGKTLSAKASAAMLGVPLLKLDAGKLFGSLVGESEANLRTAIQTAEAVAPCVLFVDELEKGFAGSKSSGATDGGTTSRVFGTFLQWMNDKTAPVFVFATANDITALPPEFLRKGRFDELFFVDLPTKAEREEIFSVHIKKRGRSPEQVDIAGLAEATDGFTGAEIEAVINEAMFAAFEEDKDLHQAVIETAISETVPLSKTMAPQIEALRNWAQGRARRASAAEAKGTTATTGKARRIV